MKSVRLYIRALTMLRSERGLTAALTLAGVFIAVVQLAEPILFGKVVDALSKGQGAFPLIGVWAALGFFGIIAGVLVAIAADRLAHRQRLAAMGLAFERAIVMPISYHAEKGSGTVVRSILSGTDALFWTWLWGPVGLVLSTPLTVCLVVIGKHVPQLQFLPWLFGDAPGLSPPARLYQRLIAGDQDQAWSVLEAELETKELHEVYDTVLLPAVPGPRKKLLRSSGHTRAALRAFSSPDSVPTSRSVTDSRG